jgi:hypothetical protein
VAGDFELIAHAGQQPAELVIAEFNLVGEELADARLVYAAEPRQFRLGGARFMHHRPQHATTIAHPATIAKYPIGMGAVDRRFLAHDRCDVSDALGNATLRETNRGAVVMRQVRESPGQRQSQMQPIVRTYRRV